jgi:histidinol-phosphate/aromatic aminotransferase/cobyric acid decarboxylase-like protein/choline kinase
VTAPADREPIVHGVILAAGRGRRMRPLSDSQHKGLLRIGQSTPLDHLVEALDAAGATTVTIITGYRADELQSHLRANHPEVPLRFIENRRYATSNNIVSLKLAIDAHPIGEDLLLVEADLLLRAGILEALGRGPSRDVALLARFTLGMDGTVVTVRDGVLTGIHPSERQGVDFVYEGTCKTLNAYRFSATLIDDILRPRLSVWTRDDSFYEAVLAEIDGLAALRIAAQIVPDGAWAEIDDPVDLVAARFTFVPDERARILDRSFGGSWGFDFLDFAFMANVRFPTPAIHAALAHRLADVVGTYGSTQIVLDEKLALLLECDPGRLLTLAGASQAYPILRRLWSGASVAIPEPTFGEYARAFPDATRYGDRPGVTISELDGQAASHDVLVVVNPNNPTGTTLPAEALAALAARHPATTVLVDESFAGFAPRPSLRGLLRQDPLMNVLLLTSLGKVMGVPGLRLGYAYSPNRKLLASIAAELPIWGMSSVAEYLVELTLKARGELLRSLRMTVADREALADGLVAVPGVARVHPSGGNFLLVELVGRPEAAAGLRESLLTHEAIAVKDVTDRFPDHRPRIRVGVRLPHENRVLLDALTAHLSTRRQHEGE